MISPVEGSGLSSAQKAEIIYAQARSELSDRLWRAALGDGGQESSDVRSGGAVVGMDLESLLTLLGSEKNGVPSVGDAQSLALQQPQRTAGETDPKLRQETSGSTAPVETQAGGLGPNARYAPALSSAATRTGIPASALAAIVHAEAGKAPDGSWKLLSRNPRSSAAGLGQFLSGTWQDMARTAGTWLNRVAAANGWLDDDGKLLPGKRSELLALRYDADASINTIADYARQNLDALQRAGIAIGDDAQKIAQTAYLGHHLGRGDAIRFLKGGIEPARARMLLGAQIGTGSASQRIAQAGDASAAHRSWLVEYVSRNVRPDRFVA